MAQTIKHKRGLQSALSGITPAEGEIVVTSPSGVAYDRIFIGDGSTAGGREIDYLNKTTGGTVANLTISGDLTVQGTTTFVNSQEVNIGDSQIILNFGETGTPTLDAGFIVERGDADNVSILWNETSNQWELTKDSNDTGTGDAVTKRILDEDDLGTGYTAGTGIDITTGTISNTDLGSSQNIFKTINADAGGPISAASNTDSFTIAGGTNVSTSITGNTITITATDTNTTYSAGTGLVLSSTTFNLDFSELTDQTTALLSTDEIVFLGAGGVESRKAAGEIDVSVFNNDAGYVSTSGVTTVTAGIGLSGGGSTSTVSLDLDFTELTDMTAAVTGTTELIINDAGTESRKAISEITLSTFNNDAGFVTSSGVTSVSGANGISSSGGTTPTLSLDFSTLTDKTADVAGTDELILQSAGVESRKAISEIKLSAFNNDLSLTTSFIGLTDTPSTYGTAAVSPNPTTINKMLMVNDAGNALVFTNEIDGGTF